MLTRRDSHKAAKFLDGLKDKQRKQLEAKLNRLCFDPNPSDSHGLKGRPDWAYVDFGEYRIVYTLPDDNYLDILIAGKRNDDEVYQQAMRVPRK